MNSVVDGAESAGRGVSIDTLWTGSPQKPKTNDVVSLWRKLRRLAARVFGLFAKVSAFAVGVLLMYALWQAVFEATISIEPLAVPKSIAEEGFTPEVAAIRLRDEISDVLGHARTSIRHREFFADQTTPDLVIPNVGLSVQTIAAEVRTFFGIKRRRSVTGEFMFVDDGLVLCLRLDGKRIFETQTPDKRRPGTLMRPAAEEILRTTQPYLYAAAEYEIDKYVSLEQANQIIATADVKDEQAKFAHLLRGHILSDFGNSEQALNEYQKALDIDPKFARAINNMGVVEFNRGHLDIAADDYSRAIALDDKFALAYFNSAAIFKTRGDVDEAVKRYRKAIELDPTYTPAYINLARILISEGDLDAAIIEYRRALNADPKLGWLRNSVASMLRNNRYADDAIAEYKRAAALDLTSAVAHAGLGDIFGERGDVPGARVEYQKAVDLNPTMADYHIKLGHVLEQLHRDADALSEYRRAAEISPDNASVQAELAVLAKKGQAKAE